MAVTLKQIEAFIAVADQRSFRRAAERLNTTQPNISARIASLEALLGGPLMARDAGSVRLTDKGEALLPHARRVIASLDAFLGAAGDAALFEGTLRLGVTEMVAHAWLGDFLKALKARYPNVVVDLSVDLSVNVSAALYDRSLDLALQNEPFDRQVSGIAALGDEPQVWVASPALGLSGRSVGLEDLAAFTLLGHARGARPHDQLVAHLREAGARLRLAASSSLAACRQMTLDGLGVACLPLAMVEADLAAGRLERVNYAWTPDDLRFFARYDAETAPPYVAAAAEIAADVAAEDRKKRSS